MLYQLNAAIAGICFLAAVQHTNAGELFYALLQIVTATACWCVAMKGRHEELNRPRWGIYKIMPSDNIIDVQVVRKGAA